jgi:hypothetical protein
MMTQTPPDGKRPPDTYSVHWNRAGLALARWQVQKARFIRLRRLSGWRSLHARYWLGAVIERQGARRRSWA